MINKIVLIGVSLLLLNSTITLADESAGAANEQLEQRRAEIQVRMQSMSAEDRALYKKLNSDGEGGGNEGSGYGSGYGSRRGGGEKGRH